MNTRTLAIALMLAGSVAACDPNKPGDIDRAIKTLTGRVDDLEAAAKPHDYTAGDAVINELVAAEETHPTDDAGLPPLPLLAAPSSEICFPIFRVKECP